MASEPPFLLAIFMVLFKITMTGLLDRIDAIIRPALAAKGIEIVQMKMVDGKKRKTLQILAENAQTGRITLDECAIASRTISMLLDVEDVINGAYNLEVSSPGIDRPLTKPSDYKKFLGFEARIETALPMAGRSRFRGVLAASTEEDVTITVDGVPHLISFGNVAQAQLVLSDALIKAYQKGGAFYVAPAKDETTQPVSV